MCLEEANIKEFLGCCMAELTEKDLKSRQLLISKKMILTLSWRGLS
jgi:hypothetical protein